MGRGLRYKRDEREKHIARKEHILKEYRSDNMPSKYDTKDIWAAEKDRDGRDLSEGQCSPYWYVEYRGMLSKGKIHCSCGMCSCKTKNKGRRRHLHGNYAPSYNPSIRDLKRNLEMDYEE